MSLFTKLVGLFIEGEKSEEKKEEPLTNFIYGDRVKVTEGFYKGQEGVILKQILYPSLGTIYLYYTFCNKDISPALIIDLPPAILEKIEDGNSD